MSIQALNWAFEARVGGNSNAKLVLIMLANRAGFHHECWPRTEIIAHETELSRRTVFRCLDFLEGAGFITRTARRLANGSLTASLYVMNVDGGSANLTLPYTDHGANLTLPSATVGTHTDEPTLNPQGKKDISGVKAGKGGKRKPRHGQRTKDGKRIWFDRGTDEFEAYAADWKAKHKAAPPLNWSRAGAWFNYGGE